MTKAVKMKDPSGWVLIGWARDATGLSADYSYSAAFNTLPEAQRELQRRAASQPDFKWGIVPKR
jgi:hypothetical protein